MDLAGGASQVSELVLVGALLLIAGVVASKLSSKLGVPALLLFLAIGMLAGSEGPGGIPFNSPEPAMLFGSIALALILFDGGLNTDLSQMDRIAVRTGTIMATIGVGITAAIITLLSVFVFGTSWQNGLLVGAILSSTDAAAVFSVLRARGVGLPDRIRTLLEFESGSNDPSAVFLTTTAILLVQGQAVSPLAVPFLFVFKVAGGAFIGWLAGRMLVWSIDRLDLEHDGLYPVYTIGVVGVVFGVAELLQTSGFMAVYVTGLALAGKVFVHRNSLRRFHQGVAWIMQIGMFLMLGLLVTPSQLMSAATPAVFVSVALILVARPVAVFLSMVFSGFTTAEKTLISWVGLRGAAPIILATFPMVAGVEDSRGIFNIVFFAVIISVLVQGPTVSLAARLLGVAQPYSEDSSLPIELVGTAESGLSLTKLTIAEGSAAEGEKLLRIGGPDRPLVVLIRREGRLFVPTGGVRLLARDELYVLGAHEAIDAMDSAVSSPSDKTTVEL